MSSNVWNKTSKQLEPFAGIPVDLLTSLTNEVGRAYGFVGTKQEWIDLPTSEKAKYVVVNLTDDDPYLIGGHDISGIGDGTVSGALVQLDADLGDKSSASAVTGADAFAKIATLNSDLSDLGNSLVAYNNGETSDATLQDVSAYKYLDVVFSCWSNQNSKTALFHTFKISEILGTAFSVVGISNDGTHYYLHYGSFYMHSSYTKLEKYGGYRIKIADGSAYTTHPQIYIVRVVAHN